MAIFKVCPACGAERLKPDSAKSVVCSACGFVYFFNAAAAVAAIITNTNHELLVIVRAAEPGKGQWDLPGGFADPGESAETALRREIKEELNLDISSITYFCSAPNEYVYKDVTYPTLDLAFVCCVNDFSQLAAMDDAEAVLFVPGDKIETEKFAFVSNRTIVSKFLSR
jgi:NAD+ diphosphatase